MPSVLANMDMAQNCQLSRPNHMFGDLQVAKHDARTGTQRRTFPRVGRCAVRRSLLLSFPCTASVPSR